MGQSVPMIISSGIFVISKAGEEEIKFVSVVISNEIFLRSQKSVKRVKPENSKDRNIKHSNNETNDEIRMFPSGSSEINEGKDKGLHVNQQITNNKESEF